MKNFSNTYIFVFSSIMVVIVASLLSFVAMQLKPLQDKNVAIAKKQDILNSVKMALDADQMKNKQEYIEKLYEENIRESYVINSKGNIKENVDAFEVDLKEELTKDIEERNLPLYVFEKGEGNTKYIIPMRGKGLWGPIWGYVSLNDDLNTIYGTTFDHKSETPGLGAEINTMPFQDQFENKKIFDTGEFVGIQVKKSGANDQNEHAVDAISGGTITSNGVQAMIRDNLKGYVTFFNEKRN